MKITSLSSNLPSLGASHEILQLEMKLANSGVVGQFSGGSSDESKPFHQKIPVPDGVPVVGDPDGRVTPLNSTSVLFMFNLHDKIIKTFNF